MSRLGVGGLSAAALVWAALASGVVLADEPASPATNQPVELDALPASNPVVQCAEVQKNLPRYYPEKAQRLNIEGMARIACAYDSMGVSHRCTWIAEDPPGYDFGPTAAKLGCLMTMKPMPDRKGDVFISFPLRFKLPAD